MRARIAAIGLLFSSAIFAAPKRVDLGGLVLVLSDAPPAQIFHIVDQLSQWDVYAHKQYVRWADRTQLLDQQDRELLLQHAKMRKQRGWGHGFEQTFLVEDAIEHAAAKGIAERLLSTDETNAERGIMLHVPPELETLLREHQAELAGLEQQ